MAKSHSSPAGRLTPAKRRAAPEPPPEDDEEIDELEHGAALGDYDEHAMHAHYGGEDDDGLEIESPQAEEPVQRLGPAPPDGAVVKRPRGRPRKDNSAKPRRDPLAPKRPGSAYTLFVHDRYPEVKARLAVENAAAAAAAAEAAATGADPGEVSKTTVIAEVGRMWKALPPEERRPYEDRAAAEKLHYDAAVRHYVESGAKQRWLAANPRPAGAAGSAGGTPVPRAAALPQIQMVAHAGHLQQVLVPPGYATAVQAVVVPKEEPGAGPAPLSPQTEHIVALLHRFGEQDDLEGLDEIENAIETLEGPSRDEAKRHLTALLKIKSKMMVEGLEKLFVAGSRSMSPLPEHVPTVTVQLQPDPTPVAAVEAVQAVADETPGKYNPRRKAGGARAEQEMSDKMKLRKAQAAYKRALVKDFGFPKQPESSYLAFRTAYQKPVREELAQTTPGGQSLTMKQVVDVLAARWKALSAEERAVWDRKGEENKREYERRVEEWRARNPGMSTEVPAADVEAWAAVEVGKSKKRKADEEEEGEGGEGGEAPEGYAYEGQAYEEQGYEQEVLAGWAGGMVVEGGDVAGFEAQQLGADPAFDIEGPEETPTGRKDKRRRY